LRANSSRFCTCPQCFANSAIFSPRIKRPTFAPILRAVLPVTVRTLRLPVAPIGCNKEQLRTLRAFDLNSEVSPTVAIQSRHTTYPKSPRTGPVRSPVQRNG
jgi:hypothetical protein